MIEAKLIEYLKEETKIPAYAERPKNPPKEFIIIEKLGGAYRNGIDSGSFAFQSHAATMLRAAEINALVKDAARRLPQHTDISAVRLSSDYNFTDTSMKEYRYQAVFDITYMEG